MSTVRSLGARARVASVALALAACTGPDPATVPSPAATADAAGSLTPAVDDPAGVLRVQGCEPPSLLPASVARGCGRQVANALYTPLVEVGASGGLPRWGEHAAEAVAASISTADAVTWRIELKPDWVFHDGEPVRAQHFVDAWNFAAYGPNAQSQSFLFEPVVGFREVNCPTVGCEPEATELRGLRVVDDLTIEVELRSPDRHLPHRLGHVAFAPLPPAALDDPELFQEAPVGNGPLRLEGWAHNELISLRPHVDHPGEPARSAGIEVVLFDDVADAWDEFEQGRLDVVTAVPRTVRDEARADHARAVFDGDQLDLLVVPAYRTELHDPALVQALSRAIDRRAIIDEHLDGLARPARGLVPQVVSDRSDRCAALCSFSRDAARRLMTEAAVPEGGIEVWVDRDSGQAPWARAIVGQWREHLGVDPEDVRLRSLRHTAWVSHVADRRVGGLHPLGWTMDVASPLPYLRELHLPGGLLHFDGHRNDEASDAIARALAAPTAAAAATAWRDAESLLLEDLRVVPLWVHQHEAYFASDVVTGVLLDPVGALRLAALQPVGAGEAS